MSITMAVILILLALDLGIILGSHYTEWLIKPDIQKRDDMIAYLESEIEKWRRMV